MVLHNYAQGQTLLNNKLFHLENVFLNFETQKKKRQ